MSAIVGVFNHHPENITCWAMENAIFDEDPVVSTTTTPLATSTTTTSTTSGSGLTTTTTKPYVPFPDELCRIAIILDAGKLDDDDVECFRHGF